MFQALMPRPNSLGQGPMLLVLGLGHVPSPLSFIQSLSQGVAQLSQIFLSFLMFHDSLTHLFWNFVYSIFVLILNSLTVPIITSIGCLFYVSIWVDLSFIVIFNIGQNS